MNLPVWTIWKWGRLAKSVRTLFDVELEDLSHDELLAVADHAWVSENERIEAVRVLEYIFGR